MEPERCHSAALSQRTPRLLPARTKLLPVSSGEGEEATGRAAARSGMSTCLADTRSASRSSGFVGGFSKVKGSGGKERGTESVYCSRWPQPPRSWKSPGFSALDSVHCALQAGRRPWERPAPSGAGFPLRKTEKPTPSWTQAERGKGSAGGPSYRYFKAKHPPHFVLTVQKACR